MSGRAIRAHLTITIKIVSYLIRAPKLVEQSSSDDLRFQAGV